MIFLLTATGLLGLGACAPAEQPQVCDLYLQCVFPAGEDSPSGEIDESDRPVVVEYFGEEGQCWREPDLVEECTTACESARDELCGNLPANARSFVIGFAAASDERLMDFVQAELHARGTRARSWPWRRAWCSFGSRVSGTQARQISRCMPVSSTYDPGVLAQRVPNEKLSGPRGEFTVR